MPTYKPDHTRLLETCQREFDRMAKAAREDRTFTQHLRVPIIGGQYRDDQRIKAKLLVCKALAAQEWHALTCPQWARGWALPLLLREEEFETFLRNEYNELKLTAYFGRSVRESGWDHEQHPPFDTYCAGVVADRWCPREMKLDRKLRREFPPQALLAGFLTPRLQWRPVAQ
jgi:stress-induced morphogen